MTEGDSSENSLLQASNSLKTEPLENGKELVNAYDLIDGALEFGVSMALAAGEDKVMPSGISARKALSSATNMLDSAISVVNGDAWGGDAGYLPPISKIRARRRAQ